MGVLCPRHGTLLYGARCVGCDCDPFLSVEAYREEVRRRASPVEIITDPADRRGFDARPIRGAG